MNIEEKNLLNILDKNDVVLKRLEMIRLLRTGEPPEQIAKQFYTSIEHIYRINTAFSLNGVFGILSESNLSNWHDRLNNEDPILRRLEMVRLLRSGTPVEVIAKEYHAIPEYIYRINDRFSKHGSLGILNEEDFLKFRSFNPEVIRICSYNLHGTRKNDNERFKIISDKLSSLEPELCAFQEVISGNGIEETSAQIANQITDTTGYHYKTLFAYCHPFMDVYPEGVSVTARYLLETPQIIDLNKGLNNDLTPSMERFAAAAEIEIYGKSIIFASLHLDHHENPKIRLAQAEKLLKKLDRIYQGNHYYCTILAGDFNDVENSPVIKYLKKNGYKDSYRNCHHTGGDTYNTSKPFTRIDYIMIKGNVNILSAELILSDPDLSDHIGIYVVIK